MAKYYMRQGKAVRKRREQNYKDDAPVRMKQGWMDLAFAVVERAFEEKDTLWLREFGMEFLSYSGNPVNQRKFDGLLEVAGAQEKT
jgi:hypothetical protein